VIMKSRVTALAGLVAVVALAASASPVLAAQAAPRMPAAPAHAARPAFSNPGATSPSLSLSVSGFGVAEAAVVGKGGSLLVYTARGSYHHWTRTELGGAGSASSGPSVYAGKAHSYIAVEGPSHSLRFYSLSHGSWHRSQLAGAGSTYSAPSLAVGPHGPGIAAQGPGRTLWYYSLKHGHWHKSKVFGLNAAYSAPSLVIRSSSQAGDGGSSGQADIAVENAHHSLSYYYSAGSGWKTGAIVGSGDEIYSAPSMVVVAQDGTDQGMVYIAFQGPHHALGEWNDFGGIWKASELEASGWVYSAPSISQDPTAVTSGAFEPEIAFQNADHSITMTYYNHITDDWQNDPVGVIDNGYSAPSVFVRGYDTAGDCNILLQGPKNSLRFFFAPDVYENSSVPIFTGVRIAGNGTTFGG
jgi:hypothetical protein